MRLLKVELQNFLSHRGQNGLEGGSDFTVVDFSDAPLWLIHGPNGSGKSAIFDAITFALFKQHRGGGQHFHRLISHGASRAAVRLEIELGETRYQVERTIKRSGSGATLSEIVRKWNGAAWFAVVGTEGNVARWVAEQLRMDHKTFVSCVLLRQGALDEFLKATAPERNKLLMGLLEMDRYIQLGMLAQNRLSVVRGQHKLRKSELESKPRVTDAQVEDHARHLQQAQQEQSNLGRTLEAIGQQIANARKAVEIQRRVGDLETKRNTAQALIDHRDETLARLERFRELETILVRLDQLWAASTQLARERADLQKLDAALAESATQGYLLAEARRSAQERARSAEELLQVERAAHAEAQSALQTLEVEILQLGKLEELEKAVRDIEANLAVHAPILQRAAEIETHAHRQKELAAALPLLGRLGTARRELADAESVTRQRSAELAARQQAEGAARAELERAQAELARIALLIQQGQAREREISQARALLRHQIEQRDPVTNLEICPTCGSRLDDAAHARMGHERAEWGARLALLDPEHAQVAGELGRAAEDQKQTSNQIKERQKSVETAAGALAKAESDHLHAAELAQARRAALAQALDAAGEWAAQEEQISAFEVELAALANAAARADKLAQARTSTAGWQGQLDLLQGQRASYPTWPVEERQQLRNAAVPRRAQKAELERRVLAAEQEVQFARSTLSQADETLRALQIQQAGLEGQRSNLKQQIATSAANRAGLHAELPSAWGRHAACDDHSALAELKSERTALADTPQQERELLQAQYELNSHQQSIERLRAELNALNPDNLPPLAQLETEQQQMESALAQKGKQVHDLLIELGTLRQQQKDYAAGKQALEVVEHDVSIYTRLQHAFGRDGLQAQIVQEAQKKLQQYANETLRRLTQGRWQIELDAQAGDKLEIMVCDLDAPGEPKPRLFFESLSDGEKARVAISLAIAIGQSVAGGRTVDTLVIDEGFGMLDSVNRDLLVDELQRLSEEVFAGRGRIIVVSHQEDVCDRFSHRYHVFRDDSGGVLVERSSA